MRPEPQTWRFGAFLLDRRKRALTACGKPVRLDGKAFDLLEYLVERHADTPSRDEIVAHVWRGLAVSENNLSVQLSALRRALAEHGGDGLILTLPGRRYRFVGDLAPAPPDDPADAARPPPGPASPARPRPHGRTLAIAAIVMALVLPAAFMVSRTGRPPLRSAEPGLSPGLSIVVLPFRNRSDDRAEDYLADAVTDDLTTELARIPGGTVIARETAGILAARRMPAAEIGRALNVRYLVEGSVEPQEAALHINAQLIDTATSAQVWSRRFDVPRARMSDARDLIVARISEALDMELVQAESARSLRDRPDNPGAVDLFYQARSVLDQGDTLRDYIRAQHLLEQAIAAQPDFGDALAELGWMLVCKLSDTDDPEEGADFLRAGTVIAKALRISHHNPLALAASGRLQANLGDYPAAVASARAALGVAPNSAQALLVLAGAEFYQGHLEEAAAPLLASLTIDPEGPTSKLRTMRLGNIRVLQGKPAEAIVLLRRALAGDTDPAPGEGEWDTAEKAHLLLIAATQQTGETASASRLYAFYAGIWQHRTTWRIFALAPRALGSLPGYAAYLDALQKAGMPRFADEHADDGVQPPSAPLADSYFTPTPLRDPAFATIDTAAMQALERSGRPLLVIDVGTGTAAIPHAEWADTPQRPQGDDAYVDSLAGPFRERFPGAPIVVMSDGTYGSASYNAARHLASAAKPPVLWYRGGEEAWARASLPAEYRGND